MKKVIIFILILLLTTCILTACDNQQAVRGIQNTFITDDGCLVIVYNDGTQELLGCVVGKDGLNGKDGIDGKDGINGINGTNGKDGKDGRDGIDGKNGKDGIDGAKGEKGDTGERGEKGEKGDKGDQGEQGIQGIQGEQGIAGRDGIDGINGIDGKDSIRYVETIKSLPLTFYEDYNFTNIKKGDKLEWYAFSISYSPYLGTWGYPIYKSTLSQFDLAGNGMGNIRRITLNTTSKTTSCGLNGYHNLTGQQTVYVCGTVTKAGYTDTYYGNYRQYWIYIDVELVVEANYLVAHYNEL